MLAVVPFLWTPFMGPSLVFMIVYIWAREFPNARINIYGVVSLKVQSLTSVDACSALGDLRLSIETMHVT